MNHLPPRVFLAPAVKTFLCFLLILSGLSWPSLAQEELTPEQQKARDMALPALDRSALKPSAREEAEILPGERNPFGLVSGAPASAGAAPVAETEEQKLRRTLGSMRIGGLTGSPGSYRVLLGPMPLREGDLLPRMFSTQAELLTVQKITDKKVSLVFVEKDTNQPPRVIELAIDLKPRVNSMMAGEAFNKLVTFGADGEPSVPPLAVPGVQSFMEGAQASQLQSLVDRPSDMMGDATPKKPDEKAPATTETAVP